MCLRLPSGAKYALLHYHAAATLKPAFGDLRDEAFEDPIQQNGTVQHVLAGAPYGMVDEVSMPVKKWLTRTFVMARQGEFCQMYRG